MKLKSTENPFLALVLSATLLAAACHGATFDHEVKPRANDGFSQAIFRLWLPDVPGPVRGMIVESGQGGKAFFLQPEWLTFARKHQLAMLTNFVTGNAATNKAQAYEQGPIYEPSFTQALQALAAASKHPEIMTVPLLAFGPCQATNGGFFPWRMKTTSLHMGQRVVAFAATGWMQTGPGFAKERISASLRDIPGLLVISQKTEAQYAGTAKAIFAANRKQGAPWCLAVAESDKANHVPLLMAFFEGVLTQRVPPPAKTTPAVRTTAAAIPLKPVDEGKGWLGDLTTKEVSSSLSYTRPRGEAVWLPDEASAKLWQELISAK